MPEPTERCTRPAPSGGCTDTTVAMVTLGCARNEVDSEELAGRLEAGGFRLVEDPADAETVVVNTCGFVEAAKKDSVDTLLAAADLKQDGGPRSVVAVGCMAERYGAELATAMPEADAVLGFDDYPDIAGRLRAVLAGEQLHPHTPQDRRRLLPVSPVDRAATPVAVPGHGDTADIGSGGPASGPRAVRRRLDTGPMAPLKLASGCDRRCTFCAIPGFRGSFLSRRPADVLAEARWLAGQGVREVFCVSENTTSYGKDLGDVDLLETLLPELAAVEGIERVRLSYLQPAETRSGLVRTIAATPGVANYFDLSFQHAAPAILRRMRRFGGAEEFMALLTAVRGLAPGAGVRSNVIVGFPGETEQDFATLCDFLGEARLDAIGVFGYSDEDGTEAATYDGKLDDEEIAARVSHLTDLCGELTAQRAEERVGEPVEVLVEDVGVDGDATLAEGRAASQGPEVDGSTLLRDAEGVAVGDLVTATVVGSEGVDLVAVPDPAP
ncbi:MAG: 30S ribosomal protein S12 methylthiotransferase RimO [Marmoricola sp.]